MTNFFSTNFDSINLTNTDITNSDFSYSTICKLEIEKTTIHTVDFTKSVIHFADCAISDVKNDSTLIILIALIVNLIVSISQKLKLVKTLKSTYEFCWFQFANFGF